MSPGEEPAVEGVAGALSVVKVFSNMQAADVVASTLRANGIECSLAADDGAGMLLNFQTSEGVRLLVPSSQLAEAHDLLQTKAEASQAGETPALPGERD